jgi:histidine triad (HIT) family protein
VASVFSRIVSGEIPCYKIAESENCFAFLDINPLQRGHTLVIPKQETDYLFDLDDELLCELTQFAKRIAHAIQKAIPCQRVGVAVIGLEVPHAHIHLIPISRMSDMDFSNPKLQLTKEEMEEIAKQVAANL